MADPESHREHVREAGETIHEMRAQRRESLPKRERVVQSIVSRIGRPWFVAAVIGFIIVWVVLNVVLRPHGLSFDTDTFSLLNVLSQLVSLVLVLTILSGQNSLRTLEEDRERLTLQMSLIIDKKISEVLRRTGAESDLDKPTDLHNAAEALHEAERQTEHE